MSASGTPWEEARCALFGTGIRAGLVERLRDDESLVAAARQWHPFLAAYCAVMGRDRLAYAPIHDEHDDGALSELQLLRDMYTALAVPWEERCARGLPLNLTRRGELRKPEYRQVLACLLRRGAEAPAGRSERTPQDASADRDLAADADGSR